MYYILYIILGYYIFQLWFISAYWSTSCFSYTHICQHNIHLYLSYVHCLFALLSLTFICPLCLWFIVTHLYMSISTLVYCHSTFICFICLFIFTCIHHVFCSYGNTTHVQQVGLWATVHRNQPDGSSREGVPVWSSSGCDLSGPTVSTRHRERESHTAIPVSFYCAYLKKAAFMAETSCTNKYIY